MSKVFVLDTYQKPLNPVHPGRARILLTQGKASVFRMYPFTIILKIEVEQPRVEPLRIKLDPGAKTTGIAIINDASGEIIFAAELQHRSNVIRKRLHDRRNVRNCRRQRKTRYRKQRYANRLHRGKRPSLESRMANILTWVNRFSWYCPIVAISMELVKFNLQKMENPEISGVEYQQGTLAGYELREYLLEKWNRRCAYCEATNVPLQVEHIYPRAKGGTNRLSNLTLACEKCNQKKGTQNIAVFLKKKPDLLARIQAQAKAPLKDAAAMNITRWILYERLKQTGLPVECGSGGLTKYNRSLRGFPKKHWIDAACVGESTPNVLSVKGVTPLFIAATGHGRRQICQVKFGFPVKHRQRRKHYFGFQTGDIAKIIIPKGVYTGTYVSRITVRSDGYFKLRTLQREISFNHLYGVIIHRCDGYSYR